VHTSSERWPFRGWFEPILTYKTDTDSRMPEASHASSQARRSLGYSKRKGNPRVDVIMELGQIRKACTGGGVIPSRHYTLRCLGVENIAEKNPAKRPFRELTYIVWHVHPCDLTLYHSVSIYCLLQVRVIV